MAEELHRGPAVCNAMGRQVPGREARKQPTQKEAEAVKWTETPWDAMSREELIRELIKMQSAIRHAHFLLSIDYSYGQSSPFWQKGGNGWMAYESARNCICDDFPALRYVDSVASPSLGRLWTTCTECNAMFGTNGSGETMEGKTCKEAGFGKPGCAGVHRLITWDDLRKEPIE